MVNFIEIDIPYKSSLANDLKRYIATFPNINNFKCEYITNSSDNFMVELEINYGDIAINYLFEGENYLIHIKYTEEGTVVGTYYSAEKLEKLLIKIEYTDNDKELKRKCINSFLIDAKKHCNKKNEDEVICKILKNTVWSTLSKLPKRDISTIYLPDKEKDKIVEDMRRFFNLKEEYHNLGIPWKRNYLLEGPPGSGKTSLIFALASMFDMNVYIINLGPKVDDSVFMSAVSNLSKNSILLLEDIDGLFVERKTNDSNKSMVSFSGILNVLDGIARKNGLVTIMTTNYINRLDSALIRPGRIDIIINFKNADKDQIEQIFYKFFPDRDDFEKLYSKISYLKYSLCVIQKFFIHVKFNSDNIDTELHNVSILKKMIEELDNTTKMDKSNMFI